jgi:hypothetical protein
MIIITGSLVKEKKFIGEKTPSKKVRSKPVLKERDTRYSSATKVRKLLNTGLPRDFKATVTQSPSKDHIKIVVRAPSNEIDVEYITASIKRVVPEIGNLRIEAGDQITATCYVPKKPYALRPETNMFAAYNAYKQIVRERNGYDLIAWDRVRDKLEEYGLSDMEIYNLEYAIRSNHLKSEGKGERFEFGGIHIYTEYGVPGMSGLLGSPQYAYVRMTRIDKGGWYGE